MKKSEILRIIEKKLDPCNSTYGTHRKNAAERILEGIEAAGMLPPLSATSREELNRDIQTSIHINSIIEDSDCILDYFSWEPDHD